MLLKHKHILNKIKYFYAAVIGIDALGSVIYKKKETHLKNELV